jgi:hypothetical protein
MYRKRKRSDDVDVEALKDELREELRVELTQDITEGIMAKLREQGMNLVPSSNTLSCVGGMKSSCASAPDEDSNVHLDGHPNPLDLLTEPTLCTLVINPGGYQVEVGRGKVFPQQTHIYSVPVLDGYVVVLVEFVYPQHEGFVLTLPPSAEITTLGKAMFKRVQWRKSGIVVSPTVLSTKSSLEPTLPLGTKSSLKDVVVSNVSSSRDEKANSAPIVGNCASKEHAKVKKRTNKSTHAPAGCPLAPRAPNKRDTKQDQQEAEPTKSSKSTPLPSVWIRPNSKFKFGQPMLSAKEVEKAGPGCVAIHAYYMKACAENRNTGIVGRVERQYFWRELESEPLTVGFEDLFDLLTLDALDVAILRVLTL